VSRLRQSSAVVTGAGGGIGRATAIALANAGATVAVTDLAGDLAEETAAMIRAAGGQAVAIQADVSDWNDVERLRDDVLQRHESVDVLVANAGIDDIADFLSGDVERWRRVLETNVLGLAYSIRAFAPAMKERGSGDVVIMASQAGRTLYPGEPIYLASKWAAVGLGGALQKEFASIGIRVTLIEPGLVDTPMTQATEAGRRELAAVRPLKPEHVATAVLYALEQPPHVNVHEIVVRPVEQGL
jgi:NADP-dependent 3-hydroxy acid dehydrogenase YdfG